MKGDVFFPSTFSPTPPLPISKSQYESPPSSPSSTPPSTPTYSSTSPSSLSSSFSSPTSAFSSPISQYLSCSAPSHPSPFLSHSPPSSPCPTPPTTTVMAATLFFPPPTLTSTPFRSHQREVEDTEVEEVEVDDPPIARHHHIHHHHHHMHHTTNSGDQIEKSAEVDRDDSHLINQDVDVDVGVDVEDVEEVEVEDVEVVEVEDEPEDNEDHCMHHDAADGVVVAGAAAVGLEVATFLRRVTLKPRRTLSLSPAPARPGVMSMGRNLRAACWLDYTDKDDDDGLCRPPDCDSEAAKRKTENDENGNLPDCPDKTESGVHIDSNNNTTNNNSSSNSNNNNNNANNSSVVVGTRSQVTNTITSTTNAVGVGTGAVRYARRGAILLGASASLPALSTIRRSSVKRPLEVTLPYQEIQYLDISYQKVGTNMVQFSPVTIKKIAYHPVLHHAVHYREVSYCSDAERPVKRKPLVRSHSFAVSDLRERVDSEWSYKFR